MNGVTLTPYPACPLAAGRIACFREVILGVNLEIPNTIAGCDQALRDLCAERKAAEEAGSLSDLVDIEVKLERLLDRRHWLRKQDAQ